MFPHASHGAELRMSLFPFTGIGCADFGRCLFVVTHLGIGRADIGRYSAIIGRLGLLVRVPERKAKTWGNRVAAASLTSAHRTKTHMSTDYVTRYSLRQICRILEIPVPPEHQAHQDEPFTNMAYSLHFATAGGAYFNPEKEAVDPDHTLQKLAGEGVAMAFLRPEFQGHPQLGAVPHIIIESPYKAVQILSASIRDDIGMNVVGVTGSIGKTSTKDMIYQVLRRGHVAARSRGNQNTIYPLFDNMQRLPHDTQFFVQEFGIKNKGTMPNAVNACVPNAAVITNIQEPHLEVFGTKENILQEKLAVARKMPAGCPLFLNYDDELLRTVQLPDHPIISFAVEDPAADYHAENIADHGATIGFDIVHGDTRIPAQLNSPGAHNIGNALAACAVGQWFGIPQDDIVAGIAAYHGQGIRQNITNVGGYTLYLDCYNTAPASLLGSLAVLDNMEVPAGGRRIAVMSDMPRMGEEEARIHQETGEKIGNTKLDLALCFGDDNARILADAISAQGISARYTADREQLNQWVADEVTRKDVVLFKGSVPRLLPKTVDAVFGTALHAISEHYEYETEGDFRLKVIWEGPHPEAKTVAINDYQGTAESLRLPASYEGAAVFTTGAQAFRGNETLRQVEIPAPIYNVGNSSFRGCANLQHVQLPDTLKVIGANAYRSCSSLTEVQIPEGVTEIGDNAFRDCASLTHVTIPSTVGRIGSYAFVGCHKVRFTVTDNPYASERVKKWKKKQSEPSQPAVAAPKPKKSLLKRLLSGGSRR